MSSAFWMRLDGVPATEIAAHTPPTWETLADGGNGEATWAFSLTLRSQHQALRQGALVEIFCGSSRIYLGRMAEPDRTTWECAARGIHTDAYRIPALDGSGNATLSTATAVTTAVAPPWHWFVSNPDGVGGVLEGGIGDPMMVGELFDKVAEQEGKRWGQGPNGALFLRANPTTPRWLITPGAAAFGVADDDYSSHLVGRYFDGINNLTLIRSRNASAARWGASAEFVDLTDRGVLTEAQAAAALDAMLPEKAQPGWTNGVTLSREQLTTMGGTPAFLASVRAGSLARVLGLPSTYGVLQAPWLDVVIGKTRYTAGAHEIYVEPTNTVPRVLRDVVAAA